MSSVKVKITKPGRYNNEIHKAGDYRKDDVLTTTATYANALVEAGAARKLKPRKPKVAKVEEPKIDNEIVDEIVDDEEIIDEVTETGDNEDDDSEDADDIDGDEEESEISDPDDLLDLPEDGDEVEEKEKVDRKPRKGISNPFAKG